MAVAVDAGVLSKRNRFDEVSRDAEPPIRSFFFAKNTFKPDFKLGRMRKTLRDLNLKRVVGAGTPSWFSPNSQNSVAPYADVLACRDLRPNIRRLETCWYVRLFSPRIAIRRCGKKNWWIAIGDLCGVIAKVWPLVANGDVFMPVVKNESKAETVTCHDPAEFEAVPLKILSLIRQAIQQEVKQHGFFVSGSIVRLKASSEYGSLPISCVFDGEPKPLLETAALQGFWDLPANYLQKLAKHIECPLQGMKVFEILIVLVPFILDYSTDTLDEERARHPLGAV